MEVVTDVRRLLERSVDGYAPDAHAGLEATLGIVARRDRRRRAGAAVAALALFAAMVAALGFVLTLRRPSIPASTPSFPPSVRPATPVVVPAAVPPSGGISLCAAPEPGAIDCDTVATYQLGDVVELRGERREPLPAGMRAEMWWRIPHRREWRRVEVVTADERGQIIWTWQSSESDSAGRGTYAFQLRMAPHSASPVVEVRLLQP